MQPLRRRPKQHDLRSMFTSQQPLFPQREAEPTASPSPDRNSVLARRAASFSSAASTIVADDEPLIRITPVRDEEAYKKLTSLAPDEENFTEGTLSPDGEESSSTEDTPGADEEPFTGLHLSISEENFMIRWGSNARERRGYAEGSSIRDAKAVKPDGI